MNSPVSDNSNPGSPSPMEVYGADQPFSVPQLYPKSWQVLVAETRPMISPGLPSTIAQFSQTQFSQIPDISLGIVNTTQGMQDFLGQHPQTAVLFLALTPDSPQADLAVIDTIRQTLQNPWVQIILCGTLPADFELTPWLLDHRLHHYLDVGQLTAHQLLQSLVSALRSYDDRLALWHYQTQLAQADRLESQKQQFVEQRIRTSEAKLRDILEAMTDIVLILDGQGHQIEISPTSHSWADDFTVQAIHETVRYLIQEETGQTWLQQVQQCLEEQRLIHFDYSLMIEGQDIWFTASLSPISEQLVLWVARNISDRKQSEDELRQAKEAADQANQAKSDFLAKISQELQTPLNAILVCSQLVGRDPSLPAAQRENLDLIHRSSEQLLKLIQDLGQISQAE